MRKAKLRRTTTETDIRISLNLDGQGRAKISTGIPFLDHMLTLVARHGAMDLELTARGDLEVDQHHTVEDTGIVLGEAVRKALGSKKRNSARRIFSDAHGRNSGLCRHRFQRAPASGLQMEILRETRWRHANRIAGGFFRRLRAGSRSQRAFANCNTAGRRIIRWKQFSRRLRGRCGLRPRAIRN